MGASPTLDSFVAEVWAPRARRRLAPKTWERDAIVYQKHIRPALGERPMASLDVEDLVGWQDGLEEAGVGAPTLIKAIGILSSIFGEAARRPRSTGVHGNPVALLERPSAKRRRRPLVWGPAAVERVRFELVAKSLRVGPAKKAMAWRDGLLEMAGCRPGEALALRWEDIGPSRIRICRTLSGKEIVDGTKTGRDRTAPLLTPLQADLEALRELSDDPADAYLIRTPAGGHWVETDWRNYRARHFRRALQRVEEGWGRWRARLPRPDEVRESVAGLAATRP